ncbi:MAG: hypothetical protein WDN24_18545 [Sphingomonas sp.]
MNDHSPRRYKGTLLERAAQQFGTQPQHPAQASAQPEPRPAPPAQAYPFDEYAPPVLRRGYAIETPRARARGGAAQRPPRRAGRPRAARAAGDDRPRRLGDDARRGIPAGEAPAPPHRAGGGGGGFDARAHDPRLLGAARRGQDLLCAINLALSMAAEKDVEILLVDADFAKPDVLERLGIPNGPGLLDALAAGFRTSRTASSTPTSPSSRCCRGHAHEQRHRAAGERPRARDPRRAGRRPIRAAS